VKRAPAVVMLDAIIGPAQVVVLLGGLGGLVVGVLAVFHGGTGVVLAGAALIVGAIVFGVLASTWLLYVRVVVARDAHRQPTPDAEIR
jgi:hypothetical protein